jgi:hypothetical protein
MKIVVGSSSLDNLGFSSRNGARQSGVSGTYGEERSSEPYEGPLPYNLTRRGKWVKFSGTDEELAKIALDHAKYIAAKRRPLLKQISHSMSRRNGFNSQEEFDTVDEHWSWSTNNSFENNPSLQAINCSICGNYIRVSTTNFPLPEHIRCKCYHDDNDFEEFVENEYEETKEYEETY